MTVSFALATSSMAFLLFAFLYFIIDISEFWAGFPFNHAGKYLTNLNKKNISNFIIKRKA